MLASLGLLQSFVKQMRRGVVEAMLALPKQAPKRASLREEERALEHWLFDRDSRRAE